MNSSNPDRPRARRVWFAAERLHLELEDGRVVSVPYDRFDKLAHASPAERERWELIGAGVGVRWPALDEDLSTDGLVRDAERIVPASLQSA